MKLSLETKLIAIALIVGGVVAGYCLTQPQSDCAVVEEASFCIQKDELATYK